MPACHSRAGEPPSRDGVGPGQPPPRRPASVPFPLPAVTGRAAPPSLGSHSTWGSLCSAGRGRGHSAWPGLQKPCAPRPPGRAPTAGTTGGRARSGAEAGVIGALQPVQGHMTHTVLRAKAPPSHTTLSSHIFRAALLVGKEDERAAEAPLTPGLPRSEDGSQQASQEQRDGHLRSRPLRPAHSAGGRAPTERRPGQRSA